MRAVAVGVSVALSFGVVSAQPQGTPGHPPAAGTQPGSKSPAVSPPTTPTRATPSGPAASSPNKTDEKAGADESLHKDGERHPWAEGVTAAAQQAALVAFREGNLALNDGLFVNALEKYKEALKHWDHPAVHYNLSLALLNLDQPIEVYEHLNKALKYGAAPLEKDKYDHAKDYLLLIEKQLADIEVSCDKLGAKVSVDGKPVFVAPGKFTQKVRVGKHTFVAEKQGYNARVTAPYIGPGEKFRIELKLYTAEELTRYRRHWDNRWFPYAVIGAGAVVGLAAAGMELSAQSSYDDFNARVAACNTSTQGCSINTPGITDARDAGDTKRLLGYVGYGVAGAAIATGAVLAWINRRQPYQITPEQLNEPAAPIAVTPIVSPEMAGAMVQGHF